MSTKELRCTIRIQAVVGPEWSTSFEGFAVVPGDNGETELVGTVTDQSALHGLIARVRDLGIPLIAVEVTEEGGTK